MNVWLTSIYNQYGENQNPAYRLALRGQTEPLDAAFAAIARQVYLPLREFLRELDQAVPDPA